MQVRQLARLPQSSAATRGFLHHFNTQQPGSKAARSVLAGAAATTTALDNGVANLSGSGVNGTSAAGNVVDMELRSEAETSYVAVRPACAPELAGQRMPCPLLPPVTQHATQVARLVLA